MKFIKQYFQTLLALLPILAIVLFLHFFVHPFDTNILVSFVVSIAFVSIGETMLLLGIDSTIMPMGELMVSSVNKATKFFIFLIFAVVFGMFATIAEPDVSILSNQVIEAGVNISKTVFVFSIGAGLGLFIALSIIKIIKHFDVKYVYLVMFVIIFLLCIKVDPNLIALAFDSGGATTGIITAPFLLALSAGVSNKFSKSKDSQEVFGMVGIASLGPIVVTLIIFSLISNNGSSVINKIEDISIFLSIFKQTYLSILPITAIFFIYDLVFLKLPIKKKMQFLLGLAITFAGMYVFLFGIDFGISKMASEIGSFLGSMSLPALIGLSVVFGFVITFTEPAVVVLSKKVEVETNGSLPYMLVLISIAISMAVAIILSVLKIVFNINFFIIIFVGYVIALIIMFFVPNIFTNLAFDSGGVASGPMTSAFLLPMMLALAKSSSNAMDGFGLVGIVAMSPIIVIQILGLFYDFKLEKKLRVNRKYAINYNYSKDLYSNLEPLKLALSKEKRRRKR